MNKVFIILVCCLGLAAKTFAVPLTGDGQSAPAKPVDSELVKLVNQQGLLLSLNPEGVIYGNTPIGLSRGIWDDSAVAAYQQAFKRLPLVLPFTTPVKDQQRVLQQNQRQDTSSSANADKESDDAEPNPDLFAKANPADVYYLYVHLPEDAEERSQLLEQLQQFPAEDFQNQLDEKGFSKLPRAYIDIWKVKLGLEAPEFAGGEY